ncbi:tail spike protein [Salmonella phage P46FS4]|uniref:Tail spike protein n=1 Tax=Salmonella phage P46FS4 TaxID=2712940 RepID=A0A6G6XTZ4_9CAUD|nr:tail spike protein [Salmonella phage P46FS4]QIG62068.1 tail spike protein [Salmonella phage P46FS4]
MNPQFNQPKGSTAKEINKNPRELWRRALSDLGLNLVEGSFEDGATVTTATDAVWHINGAQCYTWGGSLPKTVNKNSTPGTEGGIGAGQWSDVKDISLRNHLEGRLVLVVDSFSDAVLSDPDNSNIIFTRGHSIVGIGSAMYMRDGTTGAPSSGDEIKFF